MAALYRFAYFHIYYAAARQAPSLPNFGLSRIYSSYTVHILHKLTCPRQWKMLLIFCIIGIWEFQFTRKIISWKLYVVTYKLVYWLHHLHVWTCNCFKINNQNSKTSLVYCSIVISFSKIMRIVSYIILFNGTLYQHPVYPLRFWKDVQ